MLIIEGPDGTGKTTLAKYILRDYPDISPGVNHIVPEDYEDHVINCRNMYLAVSIGRRPLVFDRCPLISEWVYGNLMRDAKDGGGYISENAAFKAVKNLNPWIILCCPPLNDAKRCLNSHSPDGDRDDGEYLARLSDKIEDICARYKRVERWSDNVMLYDYVEAQVVSRNNDTADRLEHFVGKYLKQFK